MKEPYSVEDIEVVKGTDAIRNRPTMYLGKLDDARLPNLLLREALCCARDEALSGNCDSAIITLRTGLSASVRDDGPGLPLDVTSSGARLAEIYLTQLYACSSAKVHADPKTTCNWGLAVLNALSESLILRVFQGGQEWQQRYAKGKPLTPLASVGTTEEQGTEITFTLDPTIVQAPGFLFDELSEWSREEVKEMKIVVRDEETGRVSGALSL